MLVPYLPNRLRRVFELTFPQFVQDLLLYTSVSNFIINWLAYCFLGFWNFGLKAISLPLKSVVKFKLFSFVFFD